MTFAVRFEVAGWDDAFRLDLGAATGFVLIHRAVHGRAFGGIRVRTYPDDATALEDARLLSRAMSRKVILSGIPAGGAKTVVRVPAAGWSEEQRGEAMRRLGAFVQSLGGRYHCGADMGFSAADEEHVSSATEHFACRDLGSWTARSVLAAMRAVLDPASAVVQGVGAVGRGVATDLLEHGSALTVCDLNDAAARSVPGATVVPPEGAYDTECDVWSPCATGAVLSADTIPRLTCRLVCGGANNPFADDADADRLHARGIECVPDVLANAGAVIKGASDALGEPERVEQRMAEIPDRVRSVMARARAEDRSAHHVAAELADELLSEAG